MLRDPLAIYNPMSISQLQHLCPAFNWTTYFQSTCGGKIVVAVPSFIGNLSSILVQYPSQVKSYLQWQLLLQFAESLSTNYLDIVLSFEQV